MGVVQERYSPVVLAVDTATKFSGSSVGGFLAKTAGTITITTAAGTAIVSAFPVSAGVYYPIPFFVGNEGGTATTAGGASGTLGVC